MKRQHSKLYRPINQGLGSGEKLCLVRDIREYHANTESALDHEPGGQVDCGHILEAKEQSFKCGMPDNNSGHMNRCVYDGHLFGLPLDVAKRFLIREPKSCYGTQRFDHIGLFFSVGKNTFRDCLSLSWQKSKPNQ